MGNENCIHNQRCRYVRGFYCEDCRTFFNKDSFEYMRSELPSDIWNVIHNLKCNLRRKNQEISKKLNFLYKKWDNKNNFEKMSNKEFKKLLKITKTFLEKYGLDFQSASVSLNYYNTSLKRRKCFNERKKYRCNKSGSGISKM